ncbi:LysM peptidoglycan-binding domain-containing protein [bacterium]|nr:LysM peptidoglycan-binding domain-containing protein [bacterium]
MKTRILLFTTATLVLAFFLLMPGCAKERARTDIALEMTDEDSVEALVDQDLLTAGGTTVRVDEEYPTKSKETTVSYVDESEISKPTLIGEDQGLMPGGTTVTVTEPGGQPETISMADMAPPTFESQPVTSEPLKADSATLLAEAQTPALPSVPTGGLVTATLPGPPGSIGPRTAGATQPLAVRPRSGGTYSGVYRTTQPPVVYPRHTVARGDSLWSISQKYRCTISELCAANGLSKGTILRIGQELVIPRPTISGRPAGAEAAATQPPGAPPAITPPVAGGTEGAPAAPSAPEAPRVHTGETEYYTVQPGDSYWKVSRRYGISASELMALNDTSDSMLRVGQKILVPKK